MSFFNLGKKDAYGEQRRIEHRGCYLRASRGFRVSTTPMEKTQVALQNGRFALRGRYGSGATKLNVSKTGASVSTRNQLGSFNWIKPNRSSAKVAGVQMRGRNAPLCQPSCVCHSNTRSTTGVVCAV